jgi:BolA protein
MSRRDEEIETKLRLALSPLHLEVINESHRHNVPAGSESHFKVVAASSAFEGKSLVDRHREVYRLLDAELRGGVHALALHLYTPAEWEKQRQADASPPCLGGSKAK